MLNLLPVLYQIAVDDPAAMLAVAVMVYAAGSTIYNLYYTYHWWQTRHRSFIYAGSTAARLGTAVAYAIVLFVSASANAALLRPLYLLTMILHDIVTNKMDTIERFDPEELCQQRIDRMANEAKNREQEINNLRYSNKNYIGQLRDMQAEKEKMTADTKVIVQSLEDARETIKHLKGESTRHFERAMELEAENERLRGRR